MFSLNSPKSGAHSFLFLKKAYKMEAPTQHFTLDFPDPVSSHSKSNYSAERQNCHYAIYVFGEKKTTLSLVVVSSPSQIRRKQQQHRDKIHLGQTRTWVQKAAPVFPDSI